MTDIPLTHRWVATRDSAAEAAGAFFRLTLRRRRLWVLLGVMEVGLALLLGLSIDERHSAAARALWGSIYALGPTLGIVLIGLGGGHLVNRRMFGRRLRDGVVLESGIGERVIVLRGPWVESTLSFDGIASVRTSGNWVFLQQIGVPLIGVWPAELFPPADLARMERALGTRSS